jgi:hypothetical protein
MRFVTLLAFGAFMMATPAQAQDAGILSIFGIGGEEKDEIKYLERPPLVVPKEMTLPEPADRKAEQAAWPKDPDELRLIKRKRERANPPERKNPTEVNIEFIRAQNAKREKKLREGQAQEGGLTCTLFTCVEPDKPRQGVQAAGGDQLADGEPARRYLTDPPAGLRKRAPSVPSPASTEN